MNVQDAVEAAIAGKARALTRDEAEELRDDLANLRTAEALLDRGADLVKGGDLIIPNREPGRETVLRWWDAVAEHKGWRKAPLKNALESRRSPDLPQAPTQPCGAEDKGI